MGDIKVRLKRVKELIDSHEWQRAYDIVDRILGEDSSNMMARVMMGKVAMELEKPEKAIECFRFAVISQPDSMPGWQGIIAYFSKFQPEVKANDELLEAYRRILDSLGNDEKMKVKTIEMLRGYTQQLILKGSTEGLQDALLRLIDLTGDGQAFKEARVDARQKLIRLVFPKKYEINLRELEPSQLELLLKTFQDLLSEFDQTSLDQHFPQEHLNTLLRLERNDEAVRVSRDYSDRFGTPFAASTIYMNVLRRALKNGTISNEDRPDWSYQDKVAQEDKQHPLVRIGKAFHAFTERNYEKSADLLDKAMSNAKGLPSLPQVYTTPLMSTLTVLAKKYLGVSLICVSANEESIVKGRDVLEEVKKDLKDQQVYFFLGHAYVELGSLPAAQKTLDEGKKVLDGDHDALLLLNGLEADIALMKKDYTTAEVQSENALLVAEKNYILHYVFFRSLWDTDRRDPRRCISHLLRSIELYPNFAMNHVFFAFWKWKGENDIEAAKEQYELAYKLQPTDPRVIRAYTDFCTINHQDERAMTILRDSLTSFSQKPEDVRWITLRLALLCYRNRLWNECVNNIRLVLRQNPDDRLVQEFLADALTFRGNYWSALGTFDSVVQMAEEQKAALPEYSLYRRATLKQMLQMGEEAEQDFVLLQKESSWFQDMCLISMAQIEISKAGEAFNQCLPTVGAQSCQRAIELLTKSVFLNSESALVWSLLGDACLLMRFVKPGPSAATLLVDHSIWDGSNQGEKVQLNVRQVLYLATVCYCVAIELKRTSARLWERLAVACFYLARRVSAAGDAAAREQWTKRSLMAVKEMLQRNPYNPWLWRTAGLIISTSSEDPSKGFRYYTKSIELFRHYELSPTIVAETWAAMGFIFLNQKKIMAAYEMLSKAQNANPDLPEAWLGMAWCAEQSGHQLEAMDLCRHTCLLSPTRHPMRRYAEWVLWMLHEKGIDSGDRYDLIVRSEAVPTATDYLLRYTHMWNEDERMSTLLSLLLEWDGKHKSALEASHRALKVIENSEERLEEEGLARWNMARLNTARLHCEVGQFEEALELLQTVDAEPTLGTILLLSVVHWCLKNFEDAVSTLEVAVDMLPEDDENARRSIQLCIAAAHLYGGNKEEAMTIVNTMIEKQAEETRRTEIDLKANLIKRLASEVVTFDKAWYVPANWDGLLKNLSVVFLAASLEKDAELRDREIQRLTHLVPSRVDFRILQNLPSLGSVSSSEDFDKDSSADLLRTLESSDVQLCFNLWNRVLSLMCSSPDAPDGSSSNTPISVITLQKALHLFPGTDLWSALLSAS